MAETEIIRLGRICGYFRQRIKLIRSISDIQTRKHCDEALEWLDAFEDKPTPKNWYYPKVE